MDSSPVFRWAMLVWVAITVAILGEATSAARAIRVGVHLVRHLREIPVPVPVPVMHIAIIPKKCTWLSPYRKNQRLRIKKSPNSLGKGTGRPREHCTGMGEGDFFMVIFFLAACGWCDNRKIHRQEAWLSILSLIDSDYDALLLCPNTHNPHECLIRV